MSQALSHHWRVINPRTYYYRTRHVSRILIFDLNLSDIEKKRVIAGPQKGGLVSQNAQKGDNRVNRVLW